MNVRCLLLVDDDATEVEKMTSKLNASNLSIAEIVVATSLSEAVREIRLTKPDVILLDLNLKDSKSLDTLKVIREVTDAVVIVMNDTEDEMLGIEALRIGADDYIVKEGLCESCLKKSITSSLIRKDIRKTRKAIRKKVDSLTAMGV
jgi:DNA-binding response OmpR family regulator